MVCWGGEGNVSYANAQKLGTVQEEVLTQLIEECELTGDLLQAVDSVDLDKALLLIKDRLLPLQQELGIDLSTVRGGSGEQCPVIGIICGSSRIESVNKKAAGVASQMLISHGAEVKTIAINHLPQYDQDLDASAFPPLAKKLKKDLKACDAFVFASPEHNGFVTSQMVNAIEWATRGDGHMYEAFAGKHAMIVSASPAPSGGSRAHAPLKELLTNCSLTCLDNPVAIGLAYSGAFTEDGSLADKSWQNPLTRPPSNCSTLPRTRQTQAL